MLRVQLEVGLGDRFGGQQVVGVLGILFAMLGSDDPIDDDVCDVDPFGSEFPGHALGQRPQTKLSHGKVDEVGTATQGGCRAGDQDGALFSRPADQTFPRQG